MSDSKNGLLGLGSHGPEVADVRARLAALPLDQLPEPPHLDAPIGDDAGAVPTGFDPDGFDPARFDAALERAVRAFQQHKGLIVDGVVGVETFTAIDGARWALGDRILMHTPGHLLRGEDVVTLQERLNTLGFAAGRVDGRFGPETERAVRNFQRAYGLSGDGSVGPDTLRAFKDLRRSVSGGSATVLRERELVRRSGHSLTGRTVVLDPGHGGTNTGAVAHGLVESELVMDLARRIEGRLTAIGVSVVFTRTEHTCPTEDERAALANDAGADLVLREVVARTGLENCRSRGRSWALLQQTRMPAVRIEAGYLSHPTDAARLGDPAFRDTLAEAVLVSLQRLYLGDDDTATTGVLRLGDLRAYLAAHS